MTSMHSLSNVTTRYYDTVSRLTHLVDPRGTLTRFTYDDLNQVTDIQDALSGLTKFTYDYNGNLLTVQDAKNQTTAYTYDSMDRLLTRKDALNRLESYEYDKAGNLTKFTDRKNQVATFGYDTLNRRTGATYPDATVTFGYDAIGRLTSVSDSVGGNLTWTYDTVSSGHHPRVQETTSAGTVTVEYDEVGRRLKLSATSQTDVTYTYDKNSRLKTVTQGAQTVTVAYDDTGRRTSLTLPNGVVTSYGYDNANRLQTMAHVKTPTTIESLTYQYDSAGNRMSLARANAAASLIPQALSNTAYDAANEQIRFNSATPNLVYDNNGNLTSFTDGSGTTTYTWNARNQLTGISGPSLTASFVYDGLGRRTSKTVNSATTGYWYDGNDVLAELSGSTPTSTYVRSLNIDEPFIRKGASDEFFQTDALGSTLVLTDGAGAAQTTYTFEPFGKTAVTGTSTNPFQYTGRDNDGNWLYYYRSRFFNSQLHRFIAEDPIEFQSGDTNLYAYVRNRPTAFTDPFGEAIPPLIIAGAAFGVAINGGAYLFHYYTSNEPFSTGDFANAVLSGAISGALSGVAGPLGGTLAKAFGQSSTSALAKVFTGLGSGGASAIGQYVSNLVTGRKDSIACAAGTGAAGGLAGSFFPNRVANTLKQASHFAPSLSKLLTLGSPQSVAISGGTVLGNVIGAGCQF